MTECTTEPWGRYSASGGVYQVDNKSYFYSFGGDTISDADGRRGGVVSTNFRFDLDAACWESLSPSPVEIGYRATATGVASDPDGVYLLFGADRNRVATTDLTAYRYSLQRDEWTRLATKNSVEGGAIPLPRWKPAAVALDDRRILVTGGRQGAIVHADAWILDTVTLTWTRLDTSGLPSMYRHGLGYDPGRNVTWMYGGLDENLNRYQGQLWQLNMTNLQVAQVAVDTKDNPVPPRLASHVMEYIKEYDILLMWGGTCSDDAELHIYDINANAWCRIFPANRPDRRDAMLWDLSQFPNLYMAQGDIICYNFQVLSIADVHVLNLTSLVSSSSSTNSSSGAGAGGWEMLYKPTNVPRGTGTEPYCDGTNAGNCQPNPRLEDDGARPSTCSKDLLERLAEGGTMTNSRPTTDNSNPPLVGGDQSSMPSPAPSQACSPQFSLVPLVLMFLVAMKHNMWL